MPRVLNKRTDSIPKDAVFIGRPSKWGNPYTIGKHGNRVEVVRAFELYLLSNPNLLDSLHELRGKDLVCFCAPELCHGDVLLRYANKMYCPSCMKSRLVYIVHVTQLESGDWCDTITGTMFDNLEAAISASPVKCMECGWEFNFNEEG